MTTDIDHVDLLERILKDFAVADEHSGQRHDNQLAKLLVGRGVRVDADAAAALDAAAARDTEAEELAKVFESAYNSCRESDAESVVAGVRAVLDLLAVRGRLTPEGGTVLTADEVADVRWVLACGGVGSVVSDRLRARFAPAEPAVKQEPDTTEPWDRWQDVPDGVRYWPRSKRARSGLVRVNRGGVRYRVGDDGVEKMAGGGSESTNELGPFVEVVDGAQ